MAEPPVSHSKQKIVVIAPINFLTGYGIDACLKITGLLNLGYDVFVRPTQYVDSPESPVPYHIQERRIYSHQSDTWAVVIHPPSGGLTGKKVIRVTTLESTRIPPHDLHELNRCAAVIVPCEWNRKSLLEMGLSVPCYVCPQSVDEKYFWPRPLGRFDCNFTVGTVANLDFDNGARKGVHDLNTAFHLAFPDDKSVRLKMLTSDERLNPEKLAEWYSGLDVFVSASRGEAWGRTVHEAMAVGRPAICARVGGHAEFFDSEGGWELEFDKVPAEGRRGHWFKPRVKSLAAALVQAQHNRSERITKGMGAVKLAEQFSSDRCAKRLEDILCQIGAISKEPPKTVLSPITDEDRIRSFYRRLNAIPKMPMPERLKQCGLTNGPYGIGDTLLLSPFPKLAGESNRSTPIYSDAPCFADLMLFNPWFRLEPPGERVRADHIQQRYAVGNGHLIQRIQRAMGYTPDVKPKGFLVVPGAVVVHGRVAVHLTPGAHSDWQRRYIHPQARQVYDRTKTEIDRFMKERPKLSFVEVGNKPSGITPGAADMTGLPLWKTIEFMATCEYFLGIVSGPMHIATALGCKCVVILNFPPADSIFLPCLKDIPLVEIDWLGPQNVHLHQENEGPLVKLATASNLHRAFDGELYPYWSERFLSLIEEEL